MIKYVKLSRSFCDFNGFRIIPGTIYGRDKSDRFVCQDYSGINTGTLSIFVQCGERWHKECISRDDWRYQEITRFIHELGYIPKVSNIRRCPGAPLSRRVNYYYTPNGQGIGSLIRQNRDNADYGGQPVNNPEPYWAGFVKAERHCVKNPLTEK